MIVLFSYAFQTGFLDYSIMVLRQCCELCFAPNTVSKFVRVFPRAALFFLALHIVILIITGKESFLKIKIYLLEKLGDLSSMLYILF